MAGRGQIAQLNGSCLCKIQKRKGRQDTQEKNRGRDWSDANTHQNLKEERNRLYPRALGGSIALPAP